MQTVKAGMNKGLPGDYRELVMGGGEPAAAFAKYLLYSEHCDKGTRVDLMLDPNRSCVFHHHGGTGTGGCRGPVFGKMEDLEGGEGRVKEKEKGVGGK